MRQAYRIDSTQRKPAGYASRRHEHTQTHHLGRRPDGGGVALDGVGRLQRQDAGVGCHTSAGARCGELARLHRARSAGGVAAPRAIGNRRRRVRGAPGRRVPRSGQDAHDGRPHRRRRLAGRGAAPAARPRSARHRAHAHHRAAGCRRADRLQRDAARIARGRHGARHSGRRDRRRRRRGHPQDRARQPRSAAPGGEPPEGARPRGCRDRDPAGPGRLGARLDRRRRADHGRRHARAAGRCARGVPGCRRLRRGRQLHRRGLRGRPSDLRRPRTPARPR